MNRVREREREFINNILKSKGAPLITPYELELRCFHRIPFGHWLKSSFCLSCMKMQWGEGLLLEKNGFQNYWFQDIVHELCLTKGVSLMGCASSGKTFASGAYAYTMWKSNPRETSVILSTTDLQSASSRGWGVVKQLYEMDSHKVGKILEYKNCLVLEEHKGKDSASRDYRDSIEVVAIKEGSESENALKKISGRKNKIVIWICDELPHMVMGVLSARINLVSNLSKPGSLFQWVGIGNKPSEGDPLYQDACPVGEGYEDGWRGLNPDIHSRWPTRTGTCLYFDGLKSPNLQCETEILFPGLAAKEFIDTVASWSGVDSADYWRQVRGFPNQSDVYDRLLDAKSLEKFKATEPPVWSGMGSITVCGLDAAWTKGGDSCMADFGKVGVSDEGRKILAHEIDAVKLNTKVSGMGIFEEQLADAFLDECKIRDCHVVAIDISGSGGRLANPIMRRATERGWKLDMISVDAAGKPSEDEYQVGSIRKSGRELFANRVAEIWVGYRLAVHEGLVRGMRLDSKACRELCDRRIDTDQDKKWTLEKKDDLKARNQGKSPDSAESRVLCCVAARKHGLGADLAKRQQQENRNRNAASLERKSAYAWSQPRKAAYGW